MKAVFSYWGCTPNALTKARNWTSPKFHLYSWVLAVSQARKFFDEVELVTDSKSLEVFKEMNLPFTSIRTDLDELEGYPKSFWALGKIKAYQIQDKPFVHIDNDFIITKPLPDWFMQSNLGFQNKEATDWFEQSYRGQYEFLNENSKKLPESWGSCTWAVNMGVYVCNNLEFNERYCREVFELVDENKDLIESTGHAGLYAIIFEQYMAATTICKLGIEENITYLAEPFIPAVIEQLGAIHIWGAKNNEDWFQNIEKIIMNEHPEAFIKIDEMVNR